MQALLRGLMLLPALAGAPLLASDARPGPSSAPRAATPGDGGAAAKAADRTTLQEARDLTSDAARASVRQEAGETSAPAAERPETAELAKFRSWPTDRDSAQAKTALEGLERNLIRLGQRVDALPRSPLREAAAQRVALLQARRKELDSKFDKARFDALLEEVRTEWAQHP